MEKVGFKQLEIEVYVNGGWKEFSALLPIRDAELFEKLNEGESRLIGDKDGEEVFARLSKKDGK